MRWTRREGIWREPSVDQGLKFSSDLELQALLVNIVVICYFKKSLKDASNIRAEPQMKNLSKFKVTVERKILRQHVQSYTLLS